MQLIQSLVALAVMVPAVIATPVAVEERSIEKRSFKSTCSGCTIINNDVLRCTCNKPGGTQVSNLDLDSCITNVNGAARWRVNGGFSGSCFGGNGNYNAGTSVYLIYCLNTSGNYQVNSLTLNDKIHNINGNLQCHI